MAILTTSQLTFCDLKDSYNVYINREYFGVACDKNGYPISESIYTLNYGGFMGEDRVAVSCTVDSESLNGITLYSSTESTDDAEGTVQFKISQSLNFKNISSINVKMTLTTDDGFSFERYVVFIKSMVGADGQAGSDGVGFHRVITKVRRFTSSQWSQYNYIGHSENWSYQTDEDTPDSGLANNNHIKVGGTAYILGVITDKDNISCMLIGTVETVNNSGVRLTTTAFIVDGQNGKDGQNGQDGKDGYTPQKDVDYFDGKDGQDGQDGKDGTDAIAFKIYSSQGFVFKEDMNEIDLKVIALKGFEEISGATYAWSWFDPEQNDYVPIESVSGQTLTVNRADPYALSSIRCIMTLDDGKTYEDYVLLSNETVVYTPTVRFFGGSNIFTPNDSFLIFCVELYKNNNKVVEIPTSKYYNGLVNIIDNTIITTSASKDFEIGEMAYFVYEDEYDSSVIYRVALGECVSAESMIEPIAETEEESETKTQFVWNVIDEQLDYEFQNSIYPSVSSHVIAVSKNDVYKSANIDINILKNNVKLSSTSVMVIDSNDPVISNTAPINPVLGQMWLDTSTNPYTLMIFEEDNEGNRKWNRFAQQNGEVVYTSRPASYTNGDLWVLDKNEEFDDSGITDEKELAKIAELRAKFIAGAMLRANTTSSVFSYNHWEDATNGLTGLKQNVNQYFQFDKETGLQIGQIDNAFYVQIDSSEMGFYDNSGEQGKKVVYISNQSANIDGLVVEEKMDVDCVATFNDQVNFGKFAWKVESNGSLSLVATV